MDVMNDTKKYITISEFAKKVGVSNQAIYQRLNKDLDKYVKVLDNKKMLNIQALELFNTKEVGQDNQASLTNELTSTLIKEIEYLKGENQRKQDQITSLNNALNTEREHSRLQQDKLTYLAEQMLQLTSNSQKLQLADKVINTNVEQTDKVIQDTNESKKSFLSKLFKGRK